MAKSDLVAALDAATPKRGGATPIIDTWPAETREAILRAYRRNVSHRQIAQILSAQGLQIGEGAVRNWLIRNGK